MMNWVLAFILFIPALSQYVNDTHVLVYSSNMTTTLYLTSPVRYSYLCVTLGHPEFVEAANYGVWLENDSLLRVTQLRDGNVGVTVNNYTNFKNDSILSSADFVYQELYRGVTYIMVFNVSTGVNTTLNVTLRYDLDFYPRGDFYRENFTTEAKYEGILALRDDPGIPLFRFAPNMEFFHISGWIIALIFYTSGLALTLLFSCQHPLVSRGANPVMGSLVWFLHSLTGIYTVLPFESQVTFIKYYLVFKLPTFVLLAFICLFGYARYILIIFQRNSRFFKMKKFKKAQVCQYTSGTRRSITVMASCHFETCWKSIFCCNCDHHLVLYFPGYCMGIFLDFSRIQNHYSL